MRWREPEKPLPVWRETLVALADGSRAAYRALVYDTDDPSLFVAPILSLHFFLWFFLLITIASNANQGSVLNPIRTQYRPSEL